MLTFEFLIVEITPEGPGINIIDTDLEVNIARGEAKRFQITSNLRLGRLRGAEGLC